MRTRGGGEIGTENRSSRPRGCTGTVLTSFEGLDSFPAGVCSCIPDAFLLLGVAVSECVGAAAAVVGLKLALKLLHVVPVASSTSLCGSGVANMRGGSGALNGTSEVPELAESERYAMLLWLC